ncbi:MAG: DUF882 domain-containing protein [Bauldia sp.]|nr:DUF882 domain-containing protein [Bauldia sp.]
MLMAQPAAAADRTISFVNVHTNERLTVVYKRNGNYVPEAMAQINRILRDWRRNEVIEMDPRLIDLAWEVYQRTGATQPIHIICGYRAPETNAMLRANSTGVASDSQHMRGNALDFYIPGVDLTTLRNVGLQMQVGGVGFYPTSGSPFVHLDVGSVRMWPRISRSQLQAVFPDGRSLYVPSDGNALPGYAEAQAAYNARGQEVVALFGQPSDGAGATRLARLNRNDTPEAATIPATTVSPPQVQVAAVAPTYITAPPLARPDREPIPGVVVTTPAVAEAAPVAAPAAAPAASPATVTAMVMPIPRPANLAIPAPATVEPPIVLAYAPQPGTDHDPLAMLNAPVTTAVAATAAEPAIAVAPPAAVRAFPADRIWSDPLVRLAAPDTTGTALPIYDNTVTGRQVAFAVLRAPDTANSATATARPEQVLATSFSNRGLVRASSFSGPLIRQVALVDVNRPTTLAAR